MESLLDSKLRTERKSKKAQDPSDKFTYNSSDENDMSDIDYHRVNQGVDYADESLIMMKRLYLMTTVHIILIAVMKWCPKKW